jgi:hypothetical protein
MLNNNIISLILKKAHKCHCWQDSLKDYCFDHTTDPDDYLYMSMEQYAKYYRRSNIPDVSQPKRGYVGYTIIIHKETPKWIIFGIRYYWQISVFNPGTQDSKRMFYNKYIKQYTTPSCYCYDCNRFQKCSTKYYEFHHIKDIADHFLRYLCDQRYGDINKFNSYWKLFI